MHWYSTSMSKLSGVSTPCLQHELVVLLHELILFFRGFDVAGLLGMERGTARLVVRLVLISHRDQRLVL